MCRPEETSAPLTMSYDYKREKAGDWDNLKIIPQLVRCRPRWENLVLCLQVLVLYLDRPRERIVCCTAAWAVQIQRLEGSRFVCGRWSMGVEWA